MNEKYRSRTFIITLLMICIAAIVMICSFIFDKDYGFITPLVTTMGTVATAYVAGEKWMDHERIRKEQINV